MSVGVTTHQKQTKTARFSQSEDLRVKCLLL